MNNSPIDLSILPSFQLSSLPAFIRLAGSALGFMAKPGPSRRSADVRVGDDLDLTHEGEAR